MAAVHPFAPTPESVTVWHFLVLPLLLLFLPPLLLVHVSAVHCAQFSPPKAAATHCVRRLHSNAAAAAAAAHPRKSSRRHPAALQHVAVEPSLNTAE